MTVAMGGHTSGCDLTCQENAVTFHKSLASNSTRGVLFETGVQNAVWDIIGYFVRMAFADWFWWKNEVIGHTLPYLDNSAVDRKQNINISWYIDMFVF